MKKTILALLVSTIAFANETIDPITPNVLIDPQTRLQDIQGEKNGYFYVRFSTAEGDLAHAAAPVPGIGLGYRRIAGNGAADISINGQGSDYHKSQVFWTAPKVSYLHYFTPEAEKTAYLGGGLAWGGLANEKCDFVGIIPSVTAGYEFAHNQEFLSFSELTISQPAVPVMDGKSFPGPQVELSAGIGF